MKFKISMIYCACKVQRDQCIALRHHAGSRNNKVSKNTVRDYWKRQELLDNMGQQTKR